MKFDRQLRPATETSCVVSYSGKTIPRWRTAVILKIDNIISSHLGEQEALLSQRGRAMLRVCIASIHYTKHRAQSFIISCVGFNDCVQLIFLCCLLFGILVHAAGRHKQTFDGASPAVRSIYCMVIGNFFSLRSSHVQQSMIASGAWSTVSYTQLRRR